MNINPEHLLYSFALAALLAYPLEKLTRKIQWRRK